MVRSNGDGGQAETRGGRERLQLPFDIQLRYVPMVIKIIILISIPIVFQIAFIWHVLRLEEGTRQTQVQFLNANRLAQLAGRVIAHGNDAEQAVIGYLVAGDETRLDVLDDAIDKIRPLLDEMDTAVAETGFGAPEALGLRRSAEEKIGLLTEQVALSRRDGSFGQRQAAWFRLQNEKRQESHAAAASIFEGLSAMQRGALARSQDAIAELKVEVLAGVGICLLTLIGVAYAFQRMVSRRFRQLIENTHRLANGETLAQTLDGNDELARLDRVLHDMTRALHGAARRESAIFANVPDVIFSVSTDGTILELSPACQRTLGHEPLAMVGKSLRDCAAPGQEERCEQFLAMVRSGERVGEYSMDLLHREGRAVPMLLSGLWNREESRAFCVASDISSLKAHEMELTAARDEAERASRAKSEFMSRMSHELRTPLNSVLGFAQILRPSLDKLGEDGASPRRSLQHILDAGYHLLSLVNDLLDLSRIEFGELQCIQKDIELAPLLAEATNSVDPLAQGRNVTLSLEPRPHLYVRADRTRLRQILLNLLSNAIKYNREGGSVVVRSSRGDDANVVIEVEDTGKGIPEPLRERLFVPFARGDDATDGAGIGLALSRSLVEMMHGKISVRSTAGAGSTFRVELPAGRESESTQDEFTCGEPLTPTRTPGRIRSVLYVEDNPVNLELVEEILGFRPQVRLLTATLGQEGIDKALKYRPDLIILDIRLPDMTGIEALKVLKNTEATRNIPVIALTAHAMPADIAAGLELGFRHYVTKPLHVPGFLTLVDGLLGLPEARTGHGT